MDVLNFGNFFDDDVAVQAVPALDLSSKQEGSKPSNDVEFAFDIGSGLLTEIRKMQGLLTERDKTMQDMKEGYEKVIENFKEGLRTQKQVADKYKKENQKLERTLQGLRTQLSDAQYTKTTDSNVIRNLKITVRELSYELNDVKATLEHGEAEIKRLTKVLEDKTAEETVDENETKPADATSLAEDYANSCALEMMTQEHRAELTGAHSTVQRDEAKTNQSMEMVASTHDLSERNAEEVEATAETGYVEQEGWEMID